MSENLQHLTTIQNNLKITKPISNSLNIFQTGQENEKLKEAPKKRNFDEYTKFKVTTEDGKCKYENEDDN